MTTVDPSQFRSPAAGFFDSIDLTPRTSPLEQQASPGDVNATRTVGIQDFSQLIGRLMKSNETPQQREAKAFRNVEELVAQTLVVPVLEKLREDPLESGLFKKSEGEKALRPMIEAEVAKDIVHNMRTGLVEQVARRLLNPKGVAADTSGRRLDVVERRPDHA